MDGVRTLWIESCAAVVTLVDDESVAVRWDEPSCLPPMTIGALCGHVIASGIFEVESRVSQRSATDKASATLSYSGPTVAAPGPPSHGRSFTAASLHALVPIDAGNVINRAVEEAAAEQARNGREDLLARARSLLGTTSARIEQIATDEVLDCWGVPLTFDEFLQTRLVELTVHAEDLACSIGVEDSGISDDAKQLVCNIGLSAAIRRNGQTAVLRALFRSDRHSTAALRPL